MQVLETLMLMFVNYFSSAILVILFVIPHLLVFALIRKLYDKIKKQKRLNGVIVSEYNYKVIKNHAKGMNESVKKRITTILNTSYSIGNRYWR